MTTKTKLTALDAEAVKAQVAAWTATGLPEGEVTLLTAGGIASLKMADPACLAVWAEATVGRGRIVLTHGTMSVTCYPVDTPGWALQVWCASPVVQAEQRIACAAVQS